MSFSHHAYAYDTLLEKASIMFGLVRCRTHIDFFEERAKIHVRLQCCPKFFFSPLLSDLTVTHGC